MTRIGPNNMNITQHIEPYTSSFNSKFTACQSVSNRWKIFSSTSSGQRGRVELQMTLPSPLKHRAASRGRIRQSVRAHRATAAAAAPPADTE
ncbi:hypothetical protein Q8A67_009691 [Cirrhinus molitorella]|uniref:Uncharacterized protein n=1 Tax=Cirrhinus molitorella TaxID=172907 RepID=A0AA88PSA4_9TELE|nr:hypothetical protein Q8A67_009691 [Cirrhinus molitorella]